MTNSVGKSDKVPGVPTPERKIEDLLAVLKVSRQLAATTDLIQLLKSIEESALKVLDCERATVFLYDAKTDELYSNVGTGVTEIRFSAKKGIAGQAFQTSTAINILDAYADSRFNPEIDKKTGFRTRNMLTFPLVGIDDVPIGVLQVLNKRGGAFTNWDVSLVHNYGAQAGVALQRHGLLEEFAEKQRLERDLDIAKTIQQEVLPKTPPTVPGYDIAGWSQPADQTGGDFFDFQHLQDGRLAISLGDVTGHGIGPSLVAAMCHSSLRATMSLTNDLDLAVARVNALLCDDLPPDRMVTEFIGVLSPVDHQLLYKSAGQGPLLLVRSANGQVENLPTHGPPMGIQDDMEFSSATAVTMAPGDIVILVTDGFFEWANPAGEMFGTQRLAEACKRNRESPPKPSSNCSTKRCSNSPTDRTNWTT
ncbi:MAG: PP2C family protein-serine/threonine phosphatase [Planctomycetota bacterium]